MIQQGAFETVVLLSRPNRLLHVYDYWKNHSFDYMVTNDTVLSSADLLVLPG